MQSGYRIGIDIGGTKINIGILTDLGALLDQCSLSSRGFKNAASLVTAVCDCAENLLARSKLSMADIHHIGVGIPGTADSYHGIVKYSPNLFGVNVPLADLFEARWSMRATIVQDSWAAAWAEYCFGQNKQWSNMLCMTIGTGIGCGIIMNGKVYGGAMHTAGEIGHTSVVPNGRLCGCGRRGCLEAYSSGTAILTQALERFPEKLNGRPQRTESVFDLAYEGDADALNLLSECVDKLAYGLASMMNILSIGVVTISGGVCIHEKLIIEPLADKVRSYGYPAWTEQHRPIVLKAHLGSFAPLIGAAFLTTDSIIK